MDYNFLKMKNTIIKLNILLIFAILFPIHVFSQSIQTTTGVGIDDLTRKYIQANAKVKTIMGFRVQIFFDSGNSSRNTAESVRSKFKAKYPSIDAYLTFKEPNFRVRVGDFRTRHEARGFLSKIQLDYPNAFVIQDEINLPGLNIPDNSENKEN